MKEQAGWRYECVRGNRCIVNATTRNSCKRCRFQKCLRVGMRPDASRIGRQPNSIKHATLIEATNLQLKKQIPIIGFDQIAHTCGANNFQAKTPFHGGFTHQGTSIGSPGQRCQGQSSGPAGQGPSGQSGQECQGPSIGPPSLGPYIDPSGLGPSNAPSNSSCPPLGQCLIDTVTSGSFGSALQWRLFQSQGNFQGSTKDNPLSTQWTLNDFSKPQFLSRDGLADVGSLGCLASHARNHSTASTFKLEMEHSGKDGLLVPRSPKPIHEIGTFIQREDFDDTISKLCDAFKYFGNFFERVCENFLASSF